MFKKLGLFHAENEGGFSAKRMCVGICGVLPALLWTGALVYLIFTFHEASCLSENSHIMRFVWLSAVAFGMLVLLEVIEGCVAGEADLNVTATEVIINIGTALAFAFIYFWNYYGLYQIYDSHNCDDNLKLVGWITLIANNVVWFMTVGSMIGAACLNTTVAVADYASGDRL
mmetsp:Transcript_89803/g.254460  ORF Transcript_89803/g.254460 Transcript_89803/m.254460 type:complete len:172 (+) Transcript_89803:147-662(+)